MLSPSYSLSGGQNPAPSRFRSTDMGLLLLAKLFQPMGIGIGTSLGVPSHAFLPHGNVLLGDYVVP